MARRTSDLQHRFSNDGYVAPVELLSRAEAAAARAKLDGVVAAHGGTPAFARWSYSKSHILFDWVAGLAAHPRVLDAVEALIGPDILLWESSFFVKEPGSPAHFGWHQDLTYWYLAPDGAGLTVWLALSEVTADHGCMRILPGTHRLGQLPHGTKENSGSLLARGQYITADLPEDRAVDVTLSPGQGSIHSSLVVHGSGANRAESARVCCVLNFVPADARPTRYRYSALRVRGSNAQGRFTEDPWPVGCLSPENLSAYDAAMAIVRQRYEA